jgi:hypothetical protein
MLRAMKRAGIRVNLVAPGSKARLAARELGIEPIEAEQPRFAALWTPGARPEPIEGVARVRSFVADNQTPAGRTWIRNASQMFPGAAIECVPAPIDRVLALRLASTAGDAPPRENPGGPIVLHVGAGARAKRWPIEHWEHLAATLRPGSRALVLAGEVEAEQFTASEREVMHRMGGAYVGDLTSLADSIRSARVFIGCDTGPTHLAAQMGVATVALFGPTDPSRWAPIGPRVTVLAPGGAREMEWLTVGALREAVGALC